MPLNQDFSIRNRVLAQNGAFFKAGTNLFSIDTDGSILSGGRDLKVLFAPISAGGNPANYDSNYTSYNGASANIFNGASILSQGNIRFTRLNGTNVDIDTGLMTNDAVSFTSVSAPTFTGNLSGLAADSVKAGFLTTARTVTFATGQVTGAFTFDGSANVSNVALTVNPNLTLTSVVAPTFTGNLSGIALSAVKAGALSASRTVTFATGQVTGSFGFDGSADVSNVALTVNPNLTLTSVVAPTFTGNLSGIALSAVKAGALSAARTIAFTGDATGTNTFDGSSNISTALSIKPDLVLTSVTAPTFTGNLSGIALSAVKAGALSASRTIAFTGDVTGSYAFDGSGNISTALTIAADSVALGTDTTGNYVAAVAANNGLSVSGAVGEGVTQTVGHSTTGGTSIAVSNTLPNVLEDLTITVDAYGHVTATSSNSVSLDTRYYTKTEVDTNVSNGNSTFSTFSATSGFLVDAIATGPTQGQFTYSLLGNAGTTAVNLGLTPTSNVTFQNTQINGSATITGDLTVQGNFVYLDTVVTVTSALSVVNSGSGPALYVQQQGTSPIAHFIDANGDDIIFADNGDVGLGTFTPTAKLHVIGTSKITGNLEVTSATITALATGSGTSVVTEESGVLKKRTVDTKVFGSNLVNGTLNNGLIPVASTGNTIVDSIVTQTGTGISLAADKTLTQSSSFGTTVRKSIGATVGTTATSITTFPSTGLKTAKFIVCISNSAGSASTAYEVLVVADTSGTANGTVYAVLDSTSTSQLVATDVSIVSTNLILSVTAFAASSNCMILGEAMYSA